MASTAGRWRLASAATGGGAWGAGAAHQEGAPQEAAPPPQLALAASALLAQVARRAVLALLVAVSAVTLVALAVTVEVTVGHTRRGHPAATGRLGTGGPLDSAGTVVAASCGGGHTTLTGLEGPAAAQGEAWG